MSKKIKIEIGDTTAYSLWDSDENTIIGVIVKKPKQKNGDIVDVTETVLNMIREHNCAQHVDIDLLETDDDEENVSEVVYNVGGLQRCLITATVIENEGDLPDLRTYEIYPIAAY